MRPWDTMYDKTNKQTNPTVSTNQSWSWLYSRLRMTEIDVCYMLWGLVLTVNLTKSLGKSVKGYLDQVGLWTYLWKIFLIRLIAAHCERHHSLSWDPRLHEGKESWTKHSFSPSWLQMQCDQRPQAPAKWLPHCDGILQLWPEVTPPKLLLSGYLRRATGKGTKAQAMWEALCQEC